VFALLARGVSRVVVHSSRLVFLSSCVALTRAVLATIGRGVGFLCFLHGRSAVVKDPQVQPVSFDWHPLTRVRVNLVVSVVLWVLVYTILSHDKPRFLFHFLQYRNVKTDSPLNLHHTGLSKCSPANACVHRFTQPLGRIFCPSIL
jgi:hypothetical protein